MKKYLLLFIALFILSFIGLSVDHHRWPIKVTPHKMTNARSLKLRDVISLPDPPGVKMNDKRYEEKLIPAFANTLNVKEGDLIKVKGYLQLVAYEKNDDDYHIQISGDKTTGDSCLIVEVPDPKNVESDTLKKEYEKIRSFIREKILHGKDPGTAGNLIGGRAYVYVTGQLFFDASHTHNQVRGKRGLRSYSLWEIHPIIDMNFAVKP
jgi:hypothetical protein